MRVTLTGATGFIGRRLQRALLQEGHSLRALVRPTPSPRPELLPGVQQQSFDHTRADAWQALLDGERPHALVLLAGAVRGRTYAEFAAVNEQPMLALAQALRRAGGPPPRVLLLSSLAASVPTLSHYAASKHAGERALGVLGWPVTVLRPPAVYGPGDRELRDLFETIHRGWVPRPGPADQRIAFIHVDDLARAICAWLHSDPQDALHATFTLDDGTAEGYSWADIAAAIAPGRRARILPVPSPVLHTVAAANLFAAKTLGYAPMLTPGKVRELGYPRWLCDNRPFTQATGWSPQIDLATGTARLRDGTDDD